MLTVAVSLLYRAHVQKFAPKLNPQLNESMRNMNNQNTSDRDAGAEENMFTERCATNVKVRASDEKIRWEAR